MVIQVLLQRSDRSLKVPSQHACAHTHIHTQFVLGVGVLLRLRDGMCWRVKRPFLLFFFPWQTGWLKGRLSLELDHCVVLSFLNSNNIYWCSLCAIPHTRHGREWQRWIRWFFALTLLTVWCWEIQAYNYSINQTGNVLWTCSKHGALGTLTEDVISPQSVGRRCVCLWEGSDWRVLSSVDNLATSMEWLLETGSTVSDLSKNFSAPTARR